MTGDGPRWWEGVASPGPGGYVLAVLLSAPLLGLLSALVELTQGAAADAGAVFLGVTLFAGVFSLVVAPPGVLVVHLVCLRVRAQWVHVLVTAVVGFVAGLVVFGGPDVVAFLLAGAVALARAAVVPLVPGVQRRREQRGERRTHDFHPGPAAG